MPPHAKEIIGQQKDGSYLFDLKKEKSKATGSMFGYLYGYVYPEILKAIPEHCTKENIDKLDDVLKKKFGMAKLTKVFSLWRKSVGGKPYVKVSEELLPSPKREYTVDEMQDYWMALQQFASEFFELVLNDPDPDWRNQYQKKINEEPEFTEAEEYAV